MSLAPPDASTPPAVADAKALELQRAFDLFNQVSAELTQAYAALQQKVASLTEELAVANGELRRQYREKEALSERLSLLLNALPAGVVVLDGQASITEVNPVARQLLGDELEGRHWGDVARAHLEPTLTLGEWQLDGRRLSLAESPLDSSGGKLLLLHDISAAHQMKSELERNQRLAAMGEMAASLAHQLRTPLATALLYAGNLGQAELGEEARRRFADKTVAQLRRLERLIQDVLLFARGESIGRDVIGVSDLLAEVAQTLEPLLKEHGVRLEMDNRCPEAVIVGGRKALFGALVSLLENALQVSEPQGSIRLSAWHGEDEIQVAVADQGPGIPAEMQARIFEPFFTTRSQGTGLGLPIALGVARAHGGSLQVSSEPGSGAEFVLRLPVQSQSREDMHS
ncbi:PAS domain-containing sensor histidine kinase [Azovibrio restrictus]|uniref:sensor histidine kinase n=1 Tax=Azovibrio restrictus TaxID=146938 RepID=UPI0026EFC4DB|nr:ATP-binding protein [Azovibrio restrictus]MDD3481948.1 ATP-binding protein [Azovibrio restrictus]